MNELKETLNHLLVHLFNDILKIEEKALITDEYSDISITDMHIIEVIGYESSRNMSSVAKDQGITVGTLTIAINNLVKKGYVKRVRSAKDRRVVLVSLMPKGQKAFLHHQDFHDEMVRGIFSMVNEDEMIVLHKTLSTLNRYFEENYKNKGIEGK